MGIRTWLAAKLAPGMAHAAHIGGWNVAPFQNKLPYTPKVNQIALIARYQSWVYACAGKNANTCAQQTLRLYGAKPSKGKKAGFPTRKLSKSERNYLTDR